MSTALRVANAVCLARALAYDDLRTRGVSPERITLWESPGAGPTSCGLNVDGENACAIYPMGPTPGDPAWAIQVLWDPPYA